MGYKSNAENETVRTLENLSYYFGTSAKEDLAISSAKLAVLRLEAADEEKTFREFMTAVKMAKRIIRNENAYILTTENPDLNRALYFLKLAIDKDPSLLK